MTRTRTDRVLSVTERTSNMAMYISICTLSMQLFDRATRERATEVRCSTELPKKEKDREERIAREEKNKSSVTS